MTTFDKASHYLSGQGVVMVGLRTASGKPAGLIPVGNVSSLTLGFATSVVNHKESQSGQRATDLRLTTDVECNLAMVMEDFSRENLEIALRGDSLNILAGAAVDEDVQVFFGKISPLAYVKVSNVVVKLGSNTLTPYTDEDTPWDYVMNEGAGSIKFNDGSVTPVDELGLAGVAASSLTVGAQTVVTVGSNNIPEDTVVGDEVLIDGIVWTSNDVPTAGDPNGHVFKITAIDRTLWTITIDADTTGGTYGSGGFVVFAGTEVQVDYSYEAQKLVNSFTGGNTERYLRFEGLNTADEGRPVVVDVFRFTTDPLEELALIQDEVAGINLNGSVLSDALQISGSKFFKIRMLR